MDKKKFLEQYQYSDRQKAHAEARKDVAFDKAELIQQAKREDGYRKSSGKARKGTRYKE